MKIADVLQESFEDNDPEWDLVTLIDTFKANKGVDTIPFGEFLNAAIEQGYDIDQDWMIEFLDRQKQAGLIADYDVDTDTITIDGETKEEQTQQENDAKQVEDSADNAEKEKEKKAQKVTDMATKTAKNNIKK